MTYRSCSSAVIALLLALLVGTRVLAQVPGPPMLAAPAQPTQPAAPGGLRDRLELESFLDGVIAAQKEANHIDGVTVAVVANGELFFAKGYGFADRAAGRKVDPARTLFRIASLSKLFTATAVMQLVEQGKLDLNADVNRYLEGSPVRVPDTYPQPITMVNLLTHAAGFEDRVIGLFSKSPDSMKPLGQLLADGLPARVRPPGELASYSNHGLALAGYIVERVAKMPYEAYVEQHLLEPLEMMQTTVRQPVPAALKKDLSVGYYFVGGEYRAEGFEFMPASPAGGMSASAVDMAHFMIAHLQDGRYGQARVLSEATARQMRTRLFGEVPELNGMMYGFQQMDRNGHRVYGHVGATLWFHSQLALLPDDHVGIFVSYNTDTGEGARPVLVNAFLDRYFPPAAPRLADRKMQEPAGTFAGAYRLAQMSHTSLAKVAALVRTVTVEELPDGRLLANGVGPDPVRFVEIGPLLFRKADGQERMAFRKDRQGRVTDVITDFPAMPFERVSGLESPGFLFPVLAVALGLLLSAVVSSPVLAWRSRRHRTAATPPRAARLSLWLASALLLTFVVGLLIAVGDPYEVMFGVSTSLKALLALPLIAAVLTAAALVFVVYAWRRSYWRVSARIYYTLVATAALGLLALLNHFNLLGYHLR